MEVLSSDEGKCFSANLDNVMVVEIQLQAWRCNQYQLWHFIFHWSADISHLVKGSYHTYTVYFLFSLESTYSVCKGHHFVLFSFFSQPFSTLSLTLRIKWAIFSCYNFNAVFTLNAQEWAKFYGHCKSCDMSSHWSLFWNHKFNI